MFGIGGGELVLFIVLMLLVLIKFQRWRTMGKRWQLKMLLTILKA
jgi:hypothetical protein